MQIPEYHFGASLVNILIEYQDNSSKDYPVFRKLISFYEKENRLEEAIKLCDIAINYGVKKYHGSITIEEKKQKLKEKSKK